VTSVETPVKPKEAATLTAREFLEAVVAGWPVQLANGNTFGLEDQRQRHTLQFFLDHQSGQEIYAKLFPRGSEDLAKAIMDWLDQPFQPPTVTDRARLGAKPRWTVTKIEITQFGGLHPYCLVDGRTPPPLVIEVERDVVLIRGQNGAGKSSIAKALTFALTGHIPCPASEPQPFETLVNTYTLPDGVAIPLPTIVPMPTAEQWRARSQADGPPIETSVEVTLTKAPGQAVVVRREVIQQGKSGFTSRLSVDEKSTTRTLDEVLGVSRLGLELSVLHMARLPYIVLGRPESLGKGVQELTGLRPIGDLAETSAVKFASFLKGTFTTNRRNDQKKALSDFAAKALALAALFETSPSKPPVAVSPASGNTCKVSLDAIGEDLRQRTASIVTAVATAAGVPETEVALDGLDEKLVRARTNLTGGTPPRDSLAAVVGRLATLDAATVEEVRKRVQALADRANEFARQHAEKTAFARRRLYARVAAWLKEQGREGEPDACPVCLRSLTEAEHDHDLGVPIATALAQAQKDLADLEFTLDQFIKQAENDFKQDLPETVASELKHVRMLGPTSLNADWAKSAVGDMAARLKDIPTLAALVGRAGEALAAGAVGLPDPTPSVLPNLHPDLAGSRVEKAVQEMTALLDAATWSADTAERRSAAVSAAYGVELAEDEDLPVGCLLAAIDGLRTLLHDHVPVAAAQSHLRELRTFLARWSDEETRITKAATAADALEGLKALKQAVDVQVGGLLTTLNKETGTFLNLVYRASNNVGPTLVALEHDGSALKSQAEQGGVTGDATQITNSSRQRAQLFSFVLALTQYVWERDGGLRFVLLDDPQSLFDEDNQRNLAKGLVTCTRQEFKPFVLTFDRVFSARVARAGDLHVGAAVSEKVVRWDLVARPDEYGIVRLDPHQDQIILKRQAWRDKKSTDSTIQEFCREARIFVERTLVGFLNEGNDPVHDHPTLQPLDKKVRALTGDVALPCSREPFKDILSLLPDGAPNKVLLGEALNWSAHFQAEDLRQNHAQAVDDMLDAFLERREQCLAILHHWPEEAPKKDARVVPFPDARAPARSIQLVGQLAASDGEGAPADEPPPEAELLRIDPDRHSMFAVGMAAEWLPPPIDPGTLLIVEPLTGKPRAHDLVLAWDTAAGEARVGWCKLETEAERIVLSGYAGHFHKVYPQKGVELRRVVCGLFGVLPQARKPCEPVDMADRLLLLPRGLEISQGDSAEPLLRKGDKALIGRSVHIDELDSHPAPAFAFRLSDDTQVLKRLDRHCSIPGHRQLLPVGDKGSGYVVASAPGGTSGAPHIVCAFPLIGFWRN
jgi:energy-coupling factor transporter ATP-binding protein EcfA2